MRRSIFLLASFLLIGNISFAQDSRFGVPNLIAYDKERFHWGFSLGMDIVDVNLKTKSNYNNISFGPDNPVMEIHPTDPNTPFNSALAFNVGIVANMRLGEYFDLRFIPSFSVDHLINLRYRFTKALYSTNGNQNFDTATLDKPIYSHYINFPLFFKFKSSRMHNVRLYVIAGGQIRVNIETRKGDKKLSFSSAEDILPIIKPWDTQVIGGFGFDFYTTYFKLSTEFKVAFGVIDMLEKRPKRIDPDGNPVKINDYLDSPFIKGIQSLKSKTFTISFIFE